MRDLYSTFFTLLGYRIGTTNDTFQECYLEACKEAIERYIDDHDLNDVDVETLRGLVNFSKNLPLPSGYNVIPFKNSNQ